MPRKPVKLKTVSDAPNFAALVEVVRQVHEQSAAAASRAVNVSLTLRNWLIGWHICEYEQNGADRAEYGDRLLDRLAEALRQQGVSRADVRELRRYRRFYLGYPHIRESLTPELRRLLPTQNPDTRKMRESATPALGADGKTLISRLSFTHLAELIAIDDLRDNVAGSVFWIEGRHCLSDLAATSTLVMSACGIPARVRH